MLQEAAVNAMIPITDLAQARAFYGGTLGLQAREESGGAGPSDCGGRSWVLIYETMPDVTPGPTVTCWSVGDIQAEVGALQTRGWSSWSMTFQELPSRAPSHS